MSESDDLAYITLIDLEEVQPASFPVYAEAVRQVIAQADLPLDRRELLRQRLEARVAVMRARAH